MTDGHDDHQGRESKGPQPGILVAALVVAFLLIAKLSAALPHHVASDLRTLLPALEAAPKEVALPHLPSPKIPAPAGRRRRPAVRPRAGRTARRLLYATRERQDRLLERVAEREERRRAHPAPPAGDRAAGPPETAAGLAAGPLRAAKAPS